MNASIVFIDESGMLMAPLLRRSWAPRGRTPVLHQRTGNYQKVSVISAICVHPDRDRVSLYFRLHPNKNLRAEHVVEFLRQLGRHLSGHLLIVWDRLPSHRAGKVRGWMENRRRFHVEFLPAYAPELNPVEYLWSYLKTNPLANLPAHTLYELTGLARRHGRILQRKEPLLRSFIAHSPLFLRLK